MPDSLTSHAPANYRCPFCAIVRGEERSDVATNQADVVLRKERVTAFVSSHQWPNNPGHLLVVPNEHFENLYTLPDSFGHPILSAVQTLARALKVVHEYPGISPRANTTSPRAARTYGIITFTSFPDITPTTSTAPNASERPLERASPGRRGSGTHLKPSRGSE